MNSNSLAKRFTQLSERERLAVLAEWACELTVAARATYVPGAETVQEPEKLRKFNEPLNRVARQVQQFIQHSSRRYPDDVFVEMVDETSRELGCEQQLRKAMERALASEPTEIGRRASA